MNARPRGPAATSGDDYSPWAPTTYATWDSMREAVIQVRPLTEEEAWTDCLHLARVGGVPGERACAKRWGWEGGNGRARAKRLLAKAPWARDALTARYLQKHGLNGRSLDVNARTDGGS